MMPSPPAATGARPAGDTGLGRVDDREGFRPDLEGLRAVAVVLVLLYHAAVPGVRGGYIGVDVFFVLSGFLITGLLLREIQATGAVSLATFYARRLRRLLPAAALCLAVTVVISAVVLPPLQVLDVAGDGAAASLYAANLRFAFQATDYLQSEVAPSPLLHFWSLGVEEQFYLFWPALLLLVGRRRPDARRRIGILAIAVLGASFAVSTWLTTANEPWAFYSLPARAWELAIGALLAVAGSRLGLLSARLAAGAGWLGLLMIAASGLVLDTATPFPGIAALLPTVGAGLVIAAGVRRPSVGPVFLLGWRPLRFLGRISYSLYLWHWPILVLPAVAMGGALPLRVRLALALVAIAVAAASLRWVEDPIRRGRFVGTLPRRNLALAGALSLLVAAGSLGAGFAVARGIGAGSIAGGSGAGGSVADYENLPDPFGSNPAPGSTGPDGSAAAVTPGPGGSSAAGPPPPALEGPLPTDLIPPLGAARGDHPRTYDDGCHVDQGATTFGECAYGDPSSATAVVLIGDSHAAQWFPALEALARERGWRLVSLTKSACAPADVSLWNSTFKRPYRECDEWRAAALARIAREQPDLVVVSISNPKGYLPTLNGATVAPETRRTMLADGLARTLGSLRLLAGGVVLVGDTPRSAVDPPVCLSQHPDRVLACVTPRSTAIDQAWLAEEAALAGASGATFVDPTSWVCPTAPCPAVIGRYLVFRDRHHLATPFATALRTRLEAVMPDPAR